MGVALEMIVLTGHTASFPSYSQILVFSFLISKSGVVWEQGSGMEIMEWGQPGNDKSLCNDVDSPHTIAEPEATLGHISAMLLSRLHIVMT